MINRGIISKSEGVLVSVGSVQNETDFQEKGLGERYLKKLAEHKDALHQVSALTGFVETNGSVRNTAIQVAMELRAMKIKNIDIVVVCSKQRPEQTVVVLGILFAGAIVAPVDPDVSHEECSIFFEAMLPKVVFCDNRTVGQITRVLAEQGRTRLCQIVVFGSSEPKNSFKSFLSSPPDSKFQATKIENPKASVAFVLQTQGTLGFPKMVCLSHLSVFKQTRHIFRICNDLKTTISYFSLTSAIQAILVCVSFEAPVVRILPGDFVEKVFCSHVHDLRIDHAFLTAEYAKRICDHPALHDYNLSSLQCILIGGVRLSALMMTRIRSSLQKVKVLQTYGLVEVGLVAAFEESDYATALEYPMSVGRILPGVKIKVVDVDSRVPLGSNCRGELLVKGDSVMLGYLKNPDTTIASMEKGYFKTTDLAEYDEEGLLYTEGTLPELITVNGKKIASLEIEEVLLTHPIIKDAAVISDENEMVACIIRKNSQNNAEDDTANIVQFMSNSLPEDKRPGKVVFFEFFQKTHGGKIKREELRIAVFRKRFKKAESLGNV